MEKRQEGIEEHIPKSCSHISLFLDTQADDSSARRKHAGSQVLYAVQLQSCHIGKGGILMRRAQIKCWLPTITWMNIVKTDEEDKILRRWWLYLQQVNEVEKDERDEVGSEKKRKLNASCNQ